MTKRLWLILAGMVVLVLLVSTSTTGALWHDQSTVDAGSVTSGPADEALAASLRLTVTDDAVCEAPQTQDAGLPFKAPLDTTATFTGRELAPSSFEILCIEVELDANAPITAASGSTAATFTVRADQKL